MYDMQTFTSQRIITAQERQVYTGDKSGYVDLLAGVPSTLNTDVVEAWSFDTNEDEFFNWKVVGEIHGQISALDEYGILQPTPNPVVVGLIVNAGAPDITDGQYYRGAGLYNIANFPLNSNNDNVSYVTRMKFNSTGDDGWFSLMSYGKEPTSRVFAFYLQLDLQQLVLEISANGTSSASLLQHNMPALNVGQYYQFGFSYDKTLGEVRFYIDDVEVEIFTGVTTNYFDSQTVFLIGNYYDDASALDSRLDGEVDESLLYARVVTPSEFSQLWNGGAPTAYPFSGTADTTLSCYLRPLNEQQSAENGVQYGLGFSIIVECEVDIREGDKVTIDGVQYTLSGVVNHDRGGATRYKRALALKGENQ